MKFMFLVMLLCVSVYSNASSMGDAKRGWMRVSDPAIMSANVRELAALPLQGQIKNPKRGWSSNHWPMNKGGINYRWNAEVPTGFNLVSPTLEDATTMSEAELAELSPTEKWDMFNGRYDYPLKAAIASYARAEVPDWFGICDGWAGAAMNHDEPEPVVLRNADGIQIPFGTSDIKALLSWYYARVHRDGYAYTGQRCNDDQPNDLCKYDMNPGAFHLVLTNRLGLKGLSFVTELNPNSPVSNHLAANYIAEIMAKDLPPSSTAAPGTVKMVRFTTMVWFVQDAPNSWTPVLGTSAQNNQLKTYSYELELDARGRVIGGEWLTDERPDFLWLSKKVEKFEGLFARLSEAL